MKRFLAMAIVPVLLAAPVSAGTMEKDITAEVEAALGGGTQDDEDILSEVEEALADEPWTPQQIRYHFEHSMLPRYFYELPENMLDVIADPGIYALWDSVTNENGVDPTYPEEEYIAHWYIAEDDTVIAQVEMPEPEETPLCYRVYFVYNPETGFTGYYTAEYDNFFEESNIICSWDEDMNHSVLADGEVLDKNSSSYKEDLQAEAELVAELAEVSGELACIDESEIPDTVDSSEPADGTDTADIPEPVDDPDIPDPEYDVDISGLTEIACPELGFSFMADPAYDWDYEEGTGITVYTENKGSIPYVIVYQDEDLIAEPFEYIQEQFTPYMQEKYGDALEAADEYEELDAGGKKIPAGVYSYYVQDKLVIMIRLYDSTGDRTVAYTAKFLDGEGDATLDALEAAIHTFEAE